MVEISNRGIFRPNLFWFSTVAKWAVVFYCTDFCTKAEQVIKCTSTCRRSPHDVLFGKRATSRLYSVTSSNQSFECNTSSSSVGVRSGLFPYLVVKPIVVCFAVDENISAPSISPAAVANFGLDCIFFFLFPPCVSTYAHAKQLPAEHFDSRLVPWCGFHCATV